jgi:holo-[acyl-carrier protein] synthase
MITGLGIDIVEVERIAEKLGKTAFVEKVFSAGEIAYCSKQADPPQHFAVRFSAKEAFLKAIGEGLSIANDLSNIEVVHNEAGKPSIVLHGNFADLALERKWNTITLSLSHIKSTACAVVIIES